GRASLFLSQMIQDFGDMAGITRSKVEFSSPVNAAIVVRDWGQMDPGVATASARSVEFIWTYVSECVRMAVVGMFHDDRVVAPGSRARQAKSEFVRFASGIHKITDSQRLRELLPKPLGIEQDIVMQIPGVRVQKAGLLLHRAHNLGMA